MPHFTPYGFSIANSSLALWNSVEFCEILRSVVGWVCRYGTWGYGGLTVYYMTLTLFHKSSWRALLPFANSYCPEHFRNVSSKIPSEVTVEILWLCLLLALNIFPTLITYPVYWFGSVMMPLCLITFILKNQAEILTLECALVSSREARLDSTSHPSLFSVIWLKWSKVRIRNLCSLTSTLRFPFWIIEPYFEKCSCKAGSSKKRNFNSVCINSSMYCALRGLGFYRWCLLRIKCCYIERSVSRQVCMDVSCMPGPPRSPDRSISCVCSFKWSGAWSCPISKDVTFWARWSQY